MSKMPLVNYTLLLLSLYFVSALAISPGGGPFEETEQLLVPGGAKYFKNYISFCRTAKQEQRKCQVALTLNKSYLDSLQSPVTQISNSTWTIWYSLKGNLLATNSQQNQVFPEEERRIVSFNHLPSTLYVKSFELISNEDEDVLFHHAAIVFCKDLGEGITVNQDIVIRERGNERKACRHLIAPYGETWNPAEHLNTSRIRRVYQLPENVGMLVGTSSNYKFGGVSLHYTTKSQNGFNNVRNSGILLTVTRQPPLYFMGMIYSNTYFKISTNELVISIPEGKKDYTIGTSCIPSVSENLYVMDYYIHTHQHGSSGSIYVYSPDKNVTTQIVRYTKPYRMNGFDTFREPILLHPGDILISTCTFDTTQGPIQLGGTSKTEMCDFDMNFYTSSNDKDDHIIDCSDSVITDPAHWKEILAIQTALVSH